ncbi:MarR family transcriptional regulator [Actinoplanes couchii]|uniref:Regulatory protein MarR n=1 Tax=Actinoplanes couchii TaxID=403638 RepID=A0ABQ3XGW8_9ACTN|nr:MarR family transcriptional regulator [Actinoplanes couchii]MDR6320794.1 hypothetical protein [Actinoplanes couchii]GID57721.1 hypothetical protein Aco03nite_061250 [Actinoplanes couchii]
MGVDEMTDEELAGQPAAYWTGVAYEALIGFTRAKQAEQGFTQPQFWLLRNLSANDLLLGGRGRTLPELAEAMSSYLRAEDDLEQTAEDLLAKGWITHEAEGRLKITAAGEEARLDMKAAAPGIRARIHDGIDDADYVTTLKVLLRMVANTER